MALIKRKKKLSFKTEDKNQSNIKLPNILSEPISNKKIGTILNKIAILLKLEDGSGFKVGAWFKASKAIIELSEKIDYDKIDKYPGIGKSTAKAIQECRIYGTCIKYEELSRKYPSTEILEELQLIPGVGPKKANWLYQSHKTETVSDVIKLCKNGTIKDSKLYNSALFAQKSRTRMSMPTALAICEPIKTELAKCPGVTKIEYAGSLRRKRDTVGDVDFIAATTNSQSLYSKFLSYSSQILAEGKTKGRIIKDNLQIDLMIVLQNEFYPALHYFTGSKEWNIALRQKAKSKGWILNEHGLWDSKNRIDDPLREESICECLDIPFMPPELRQNKDATLVKQIPKLVTLNDIKGDLHTHTVASDGSSTIEEMVKLAKDRGYKYIGISDHSEGLQIANGISLVDLEEQKKLIDNLQKKESNFKIYHGIELEVSVEGIVDYSFELKRLAQTVDYAIISPTHRTLNKLDDRIIKASLSLMDVGLSVIIAHPTGRQHGKTDMAIDVEWDRVFKFAAKNNVTIEINSSPSRLDLPDFLVKEAIDFGVKIAINTDAHTPSSLDFMQYGIAVARRGWCTADDVINTKELPFEE